MARQEWILGQPVEMDNTNFEWVSGKPYLLFDGITRIRLCLIIIIQSLLTATISSPLYKIEMEGLVTITPKLDLSLEELQHKLQTSLNGGYKLQSTVGIKKCT